MRQRLIPPMVQHGSRFKTTDTSTGDEKTGHIDAAQNEGIFFLDSK